MSLNGNKNSESHQQTDGQENTDRKDSMTGRKHDRKVAWHKRHRNRADGGNTAGIQPHAASPWLTPGSGFGDNQGLQAADNGVSNPNPSQPAGSGFTFLFTPSFPQPHAEHPETKPAVKPPSLPSGFNSPFTSLFSPSSTKRQETKPALKPPSLPSGFNFHFTSSFSPSSTERPETKPPSFPSLFKFPLVFGAGRSELEEVETTEMETETTQTAGYKEGEEDQEETSSTAYGGIERETKISTVEKTRGGEQTTYSITDPCDLPEGERHTEETSADDADTGDSGQCRQSNTELNSSSDKDGYTEDGGDPAKDAPPDDADVRAREERPQAHQANRQTHYGSSATQRGEENFTPADMFDDADDNDFLSDPHSRPYHNADTSNATSGNQVTDHTGVDSGGRVFLSRQPGAHSHTEQGARQPGQSAQVRSRQESEGVPGMWVRRGHPHSYHGSGAAPQSPLSVPTARPVEYSTPQTPRGLGRGRGRGLPVTPDSGIASPDDGGQSSPLTGDIHTMSSVTERPDSGTRRQLFPDGSTNQDKAALKDDIENEAGVIERLEREKVELEGRYLEEVRARESLTGALATLGHMLANERSKAEQLERDKAELADDIEKLREKNRSMQKQLETGKAELADDIEKLREENRSMQRRHEEHDRTVSCQKLLWKAVALKRSSSLKEVRAMLSSIVERLPDT